MVRGRGVGVVSAALVSPILCAASPTHHPQSSIPATVPATKHSLVRSTTTGKFKIVVISCTSWPVTTELWITVHNNTEQLFSVVCVRHPLAVNRSISRQSLYLIHLVSAVFAQRVYANPLHSFCELLYSWMARMFAGSLCAGSKQKLLNKRVACDVTIFAA